MLLNAVANDLHSVKISTTATTRRGPKMPGTKRRLLHRLLVPELVTKYSPMWPTSRGRHLVENTGWWEGREADEKLVQ